MTVKIEGMEMPKSCLECRFKKWYRWSNGFTDYSCYITNKTVNTYCNNAKTPQNKRHPKCPLQEVKED